METLKDISDINLVAYLISVGFKYHKPKFAPHFTTFQFDKSPELEKACQDYYARTSKVDALTFAENLRTIRAMVQSMRGWNV